MAGVMVLSALMYLKVETHFNKYIAEVKAVLDKAWWGKVVLLYVRSKEKGSEWVCLIYRHKAVCM